MLVTSTTVEMVKSYRSGRRHIFDINIFRRHILMSVNYVAFIINMFCRHTFIIVQIFQNDFIFKLFLTVRIAFTWEQLLVFY